MTYRHALQGMRWERIQVAVPLFLIGLTLACCNASARTPTKEVARRGAASASSYALESISTTSLAPCPERDSTRNHLKLEDQAGAVAALRRFIDVDMKSSRSAKPLDKAYAELLTQPPQEWADSALIRDFRIVSACPDNQGLYWITVRVDIVAILVDIPPSNRPIPPLSDATYALENGNIENPVTNSPKGETFHLRYARFKWIKPDRQPRFVHFLMTAESMGLSGSNRWKIVGGDTLPQWRSSKIAEDHMAYLRKELHFLESQPEARVCPPKSDDEYCNNYIELIQDTRRYIDALNRLNMLD